MDLETRLESLEKKVKILEKAFIEADRQKNILEMNLTLPEADIGGLHFNEQKVRAVFEKQADGWYHSRDILFLSARNVEDDNSRDSLTEYISKLGAGSIRSQIAESLSVDITDIEISLPKENEGVKKYNGADCWYWLAEPSSGSSANFVNVGNYGSSNSYTASAVGGCAPAFCVA